MIQSARVVLNKALIGGALRTALKQNVRTVSTGTVEREIFKVQSNEDFEKKVKKSDKVVVVDFFATWCNPCKMLTPRIETIVGEKAGSVKLAKVDIDEFGDLALDYDVGAVPVLMVMKDGKELKRMVGLQDTDKIRAWLENAVEDKDIK